MHLFQKEDSFALCQEKIRHYYEKRKEYLPKSEDILFGRKSIDEVPLEWQDKLLTVWKRIDEEKEDLKNSDSLDQKIPKCFAASVLYLSYPNYVKTLSVGSMSLLASYFAYGLFPGKEPIELYFLADESFLRWVQYSFPLREDQITSCL